MQLVSHMLGTSLLMCCVMKLDEYVSWAVVFGMEFQEKFMWNC